MKFDERSALDFLLRKGYEVNNKTIKGNQTGLKTLSAIDCLVNHYNYVWVK